MPRLFDLIPDNTRKDLIAESRKKVSQSAFRKKESHQEKPRTAALPNVAIPDFVAVDVETTGLDFKSDRIIEIGATRFLNGKAEKEFSSFVNSSTAIPLHITELTGIKNSDIQGAPSFSAIADELCAFIGTLPLCGHQIEFDYTFINEELKRAGMSELTSPLLDTALMSRVLLQPTQGFSLKAVSNTLSVSLQNAHRALDDARASGEVALRLIPKIYQMPLSIRQTMAACAPGSVFKSMLIKSLGHNTRPMICLDPPRPYSAPSRLTMPEVFSSLEKGKIRALFCEAQGLGEHLKNFVPRSSQAEMALQVTDALNGQGILVAEAGTGTGKSLAYLVPAALWAVQNNCRVVVATHTKNLQDQLITQDLPIVAKIGGSKFRYSILKGRSNYLCRSRWVQMLHGQLGNLSHRERSSLLPLITWAETTSTGDIEEQNQFNPKWFSKIWNLISAESHQCQGKRCEYANACFLNKARMNALGSHIVVIYHALFYSDLCTESSFLGKIGTVFFDEAHHLESSGHRHLRVELDTHRLNLFIDTVNNLVQSIGDYKELLTIYNPGKELRTILKQFRKRSADFLVELTQTAARSRPDLVKEYQVAFTEEIAGQLIQGSSLESTILHMIDILYEVKQALLSESTFGTGSQLNALQEEVSACYDRTSQLKADMHYLCAARTDDHVFWIEGNHEKNWTKLCGVPLDIGGLLQDVWERCGGAVVFTSATLSTNGSFDYFKTAAGLVSHDARSVVSIFDSPFTTEQAIMGASADAPEPDSPQFAGYVANAVTRFNKETGRNILVLFTSNALLSSVYSLLKSGTIGSNKILAQGFSGARHFMVEQFKKDTGMVLLGTDSFWEGVDVPGEACEIVIIPRLPFPVPTHPLTQAMARKKEALHGESFISYSVPEAITKFRQGAGRLIRSVSDRGALLVLDNRIVTKGYGKQFIRSLHHDFEKFATLQDATDKIRAFFETDPKGVSENIERISYVPFEEL